MEGNDIFRQILTYSSSQKDGTIMNYAAKADGSLQKVGKTTNGDFGHWFNASGTAITFGSGCVVYAEFTKSSKSVVVGQFPNANSNGTKRTIREALHYKDNNGSSATAYLVFNITFQTGVSAHSHLASIDYTTPSSVSAVKVSADETCKVYNLQGRKVNQENMACGVYIVDGRKVFCRNF
jgi:hypothetical protein